MQVHNKYSPNRINIKKITLVTAFLYILTMVAFGGILASDYSSDTSLRNMLQYGQDNAQPETASFGITRSYNTPDNAYDLDVRGDIAYIADNASGLLCINISRLAEPTLLGSYDTPGNAESVCVSGNVAYVADKASGLLCISIAHPAEPAIIGSYDTSGNAFDVEVSGSIAYVADGDSGLLCVNVSSPISPAPFGTCDTTGIASGVCVVGGVAYVADGDSGLQCVNVSNPHSPSPLGTYATPGSALDVWVSGMIAYVAVSSFGFYCINVADPSDLTLIGSCDTDYACDVWVSGMIAYVADSASGLQCIDISDPEHPALLKTYDSPGDAQGVCVSGCVAYVADGTSGLQCVQVANLLPEPIILGRYQASAYTYAIAVDGDIAYVGNTTFSICTLLCVNISNPTKPTLLGSCVVRGTIYDIAVAGGVAYVVNGTTMQCINVSNPAAPFLLGIVSTAPNVLGSVDVRGGVVIVAGGYNAPQNGYIGCVNVSNPAAPFIIGGWAGANTINDFVIDGNLLYTSQIQTYVYDISNLTAVIQLTGAYTYYSHKSLSVAMSGDVLYEWEDGFGANPGLFLLNATDYSNMNLLGNYTLSSGSALCVSGDTIYVGGGGYITWLNVTNSSGPVLLGRYSTFGLAKELAIAGDVAYVADYAAGLTCVRIQYHEWDLTITDNEVGDDSWQGTSDKNYNVDFASTFGLNYSQYKITSAPAQGGVILKDWTYLFGPGANVTRNTTDWAIEFAACQEGTNYVSVRMVDNASLVMLLTDTFYVKKDTITPSISVDSPAAGAAFAEPPAFTISITEANLNATWYTMGSSPTKYFFTGTTGTIDAAAWENMPDGQVIIRFFANDTVSHEGTREIAVVKQAANGGGTVGLPMAGAWVIVAIGAGVAVKMKRRLYCVS